MSEASVKTTVAKKSSSKTLTPITDQLKAAWELVKLSWPKLLVLSVVLWGAIAILAMVGIAGFAGAFIGIGGAENLGAGGIGAMVAFALVFGVVAAVLGSAYSSGMLLALNEAKDNPSVGSLIRGGLKLFVPVFLTSLLVMFFVLGGLMLFVIPGIVLSILMSFAVYEVVLTDNRKMAAIKNSIAIVTQNFWELAARVAVIIGLSLGWVVIESVLTAMMGESEAGKGALGLISGIGQMIFGWVIMAFYLLVYKEARARTDLSKNSSLNWMWVVAILGWVFGVFIAGSVAKFLATSNLPELLQDEAFKSQDLDSGMMFDPTGEDGQFDTEKLLEEYGQDMTEEEKEILRQMMQNAEEAMIEDQEAAQEEAI